MKDLILISATCRVLEVWKVSGRTNEFVSVSVSVSVVQLSENLSLSRTKTPKSRPGARKKKGNGSHELHLGVVEKVCLLRQCLFYELV